MKRRYCLLTAETELSHFRSNPNPARIACEPDAVPAPGALLLRAASRLDGGSAAIPMSSSSRGLVGAAAAVARARGQYLKILFHLHLFGMQKDLW